MPKVDPPIIKSVSDKHKNCFSCHCNYMFMYVKKCTCHFTWFSICCPQLERRLVVHIYSFTTKKNKKQSKCSVGSGSACCLFVSRENHLFSVIAGCRYSIHHTVTARGTTHANTAGSDTVESFRKWGQPCRSSAAIK